MKKLPSSIVEQIYKFSGTLSEIQDKFGCSARVAKRIKLGETYFELTQFFESPGEIRLHQLTWDDICDIRASDESAPFVAKQFGITKETVYNIRNGKTRKYK